MRITRIAVILSACAALAPTAAAATACPLQVRSIVFAAQSSAHDFVSYAVRLNGQPQAGTDAELSLKLSDGSTIEVPWNGVTIEKPLFKGDIPTASGSFDRRRADIVSAAVDAVSPAAGQSPAPCDGQAAALNALDAEPWKFTVLDASKHSFSEAIVSPPVVHHVAKDASFLSHVQPSYPDAERNAGVQGDVTVQITVGTDGKVSRAVVTGSSQDDDLDNAALDAAKQETFRPATVDGVPTATDYYLVYTFRLQEESRDPNIVITGTSPPKPDCPMTATSMQLANPGEGKGPDWYSLAFTATRTDFASAVVEFLDAADEDVLVQWDSIEAPRPDPGGMARLNAVIPWNGDDPRKFWVASITYADGHTQKCTPYYELVDRPDAAPLLPRTLSPSVQTVRVETRRYEAPLVAPFPTYPAASLAEHVTGEVAVDVVVNDAGLVTGALVVESSKSADLDDAALAEASKARFASRHDAAHFPMRVYRLEYDFEDSLP